VFVELFPKSPPKSQRNPKSPTQRIKIPSLPQEKANPIQQIPPNAQQKQS
jgi:hypothetical protein